MKIVGRWFIRLLVPALTLLYGFGDYEGWWDYLSGRESAIRVYERFSSTEGSTNNIILWNDESEFSKIYHFIVSRTSNEIVIEISNNGLLPNGITRVGGTLGHEVAKQMDPAWYDDVTFVPHTAPIMFLYESPTDKDTYLKGFRVCNLGDIMRWVVECRNTERFVVTTLLVGLLSIFFIIIDPKGEKAEK